MYSESRDSEKVRPYSYRLLLSVFFLLLALHWVGEKNSCYAQYSGILEVDPSSSAFPTIQSAFDSLIQQGVKGNVRINIRTGNYREQLRINSITGVNDTNRITVGPAPGNPGAVLIHYGAAANAGDITIVDISQSYLHFDSLYFQLDSGNYSRKNHTILIGDTVAHTKITHCSFKGVPLSSDNPSLGFTHIGIRNWFRSGIMKVYIEGNSFSDNSYGISMTQIRAVKQDSLWILNNHFTNTLSNAVQTQVARYVSGFHYIHGNTFVKKRLDLYPNTMDLSRAEKVNLSVRKNLLRANTRGKAPSVRIPTNLDKDVCYT